MQSVIYVLLWSDRKWLVQIVTSLNDLMVIRDEWNQTEMTLPLHHDFNWPIKVHSEPNILPK